MALSKIRASEYVDIEYHTMIPPQPNLRQQFEDALPKGSLPSGAYFQTIFIE